MAEEDRVPRYDINVYIGDDVSKGFQRQNEDGSVVNLVGSTIESDIRTDWGEASDLIRAFTIGTGDLVNGNFTLELTRADTNAIRNTLVTTLGSTSDSDGLFDVRGYYDINITDTGADNKTWLRGVVYFWDTASVPT